MMNDNESIHVVLICLANDIFSSPGSGWIGGGQLGFLELGIALNPKVTNITFILRQTGKDQKPIEYLGSKSKLIRIPNSLMHETAPDDLGEILDELMANSLEAFSMEADIPAVVYSQYWIGGACARQICKKFKLRHIHGFLSLGRTKFKDMNNMSKKQITRDFRELQIYRDAEWLIAPSAALAEDFKRLYPEIFHQKLLVNHPGVDHDLFSPRPESPGHYFRRSASRFR